MTNQISYRSMFLAVRPAGRRVGALGALGASVLLGACLAEEPSEDPALGEAEAALREQPSPGAAGIGDSLYPTLGNGGYDVEHYDLELRYETADPAQAIDGTVTISARATQALSRFNLDFAGDAVGGVTVDGHAAAYSWDGEELVVTPARPLRRHERFEVRVEHFAASPRVPSPDDFLGAPFFTTPDGTAWAAQPNGAHRIFPSNDHPRDKASYAFRLDVPAGTTAVTSGELVGKDTCGARTIWRYEQSQPMATELAQVVVGAFTVTDRGRHHGVRVRDVTPTRVTGELAPKLAIELGHLDWLRERLGSYPFTSYGSLLVEADMGFALETQSLSLFEVGMFAVPEDWYAPVMVHELAHQWFGDSVSPAQWADVWQNEGHATWYELTYQVAPDAPAFEGLARQVYELGDIWRSVFGPVAGPLSGDPVDVFNPNVYYGGALVLYALRQQVGDAAFQQIERTWVARYKNRSPSTEDFIALASEVSGQDLSAFLHAWLFGQATPPMPGHPDWTPRPAPTAPLARLAPEEILPPGLPRIWRH